MQWPSPACKGQALQVVRSCASWELQKLVAEPSSTNLGLFYPFSAALMTNACKLQTSDLPSLMHRALVACSPLMGCLQAQKETELLGPFLAQEDSRFIVNLHVICMHNS